MRDKNTRMQLGDMTAFMNSLNPRVPPTIRTVSGAGQPLFFTPMPTILEAQTIIQHCHRDRISKICLIYNFTRDEVEGLRDLQ